jgi:UDP-glucose 4-epimerase
MFGLPFVIFRPHNVYGERQNLGDRYRNVVGIFMNQIMRGEPMTIFGDGSQTRAFSHVSDVAPVIAASIDEPAAIGQVFNVGADQPITVNDLAGHVARAMGVEPSVRHLPARHEVPDAVAAHGKAKRAFNLGAPLAIEAGLARMAAWARAHGSRSSQPFSGIEIQRGLPPHWVK